MGPRLRAPLGPLYIEGWGCGLGSILFASQIGMKTGRIRTNTADTNTNTDSFSVSDRIQIRIVDDVSNCDIYHIWILKIQLKKS
jgi:hypothetical protein